MGWTRRTRKCVWAVAALSLVPGQPGRYAALPTPMRTSKPLCLISLVLLCFGCTPNQTDTVSSTQADRADKKAAGPTEEQLQQIIAKAYERASQPPQYVQHIVVVAPDQTVQFALYTDLAGFDDVTWYVLKLDPTVDASKLKTPKGFTNASTDAEKEWMAKTLFWNWSEAGHHRTDAKIKIVKDRYLIFVRGGLNLALYDIQSKSVRVSEESPWHGLVYSDEYKAMNPKPSNDEETKLMDAWVKKRLHDPIEQIIQR